MAQLFKQLVASDFLSLPKDRKACEYNQQAFFLQALANQ
jgi:hypothetical protein